MLYEFACKNPAALIAITILLTVIFIAIMAKLKQNPQEKDKFTLTPAMESALQTSNTIRNDLIFAYN